jgi:hypothetical protein
LIVAAIVVTLALVGGVGWLALNRSGSETVDSGAFEAASSPADKVAAAVQIMRTGGSVRATATTAEGNTSVTQADYRNHVIYGESEATGFGSVAVLIRGETGQQVYVRYAQGIGPIKAGVWYRSTDSTMAFASAALDPKYFDTVIGSSPSIVESGTVEVDGTTATRYIVTLDKNAVLDYLASLMGSTEMDMGTFRTQLIGSLPASVEYAIDESGRIVSIAEGRNTTRFDNFGTPIEVPTIDESTVQSLPTH